MESARQLGKRRDWNRAQGTYLQFHPDPHSARDAFNHPYPYAIAAGLRCDGDLPRRLIKADRQETPINRRFCNDKLVTRPIREPAPPPDPAPGRGVFARLGRARCRPSRQSVCVWMIAVAALIGIRSPSGNRRVTIRDVATAVHKESALAQHALDAAFGAPSTDATSMLVISRLDGRPLTGRLAAANHAMAGLTAREAQRRASSHGGKKPALVHVGPTVQVSPNRSSALPR